MKHERIYLLSEQLINEGRLSTEVLDTTARHSEGEISYQLKDRL